MNEDEEIWEVFLEEAAYALGLKDGDVEVFQAMGQPSGGWKAQGGPQPILYPPPLTPPVKTAGEEGTSDRGTRPPLGLPRG